MNNLLLQSRKQLSRRLLTVSLRIVLSPEPQILTSLLESTLSLPFKLLSSAGRVRCQIQDVTGTARRNFVGQVTANSSRKGFDHFVNGAAASGTQVPGADAGVVGAEVVEGE